MKLHKTIALAREFQNRSVSKCCAPAGSGSVACPCIGLTWQVNSNDVITGWTYK